MSEDKPPVDWWRANAEARAGVEQIREEFHLLYVDSVAQLLETHVLAPASVERLRKALAEYDGKVGAASDLERT